MAYEIPGFILGAIQANVDMSNLASGSGQVFQGCGVVVVAASGTGLTGSALAKPPSSGATIAGVMQNNPLLGEAGNVMVSGVSKIQLNASVGIGTKLMCDANGLFIAATGGNFAEAIALEAGAAGDFIAGLIKAQGKQ